MVKKRYSRKRTTISSKQSSKHTIKPIHHPYKISREYGIYDIHGLHNNPLTNQPYKNLYANQSIPVAGILEPRTYSNLLKNLSTKIVYNNKDAIIDTIANNQVILLTAGTGVGKTILVPRIALHTFDYKEKIICTIPKRAPTLANSSFVAECLDSTLGEEVGYYYQGTNQTNKNGIDTKLIFTTTGSLISRMTGNDPLLSDYKCVIVDEAHERSVQTDQLLLLLKRACQKRRDLKVIIMSATIDLQRFREYYPKSQFQFGEVDAGSELSFLVKDAWLNKMPPDWKPVAIDITMNILKKTAVGDIMIFVKSGGDANQICMQLDKAMTEWRKKIILEHKNKSHHTQLIPPEYAINPLCIKLEGASNRDEQELARDAFKYKNLKDIHGYPYTRKVVVSTNVAESSITVDGIVFIIDSGYEYTEAYDPNSRVRSLLENNIAQSAVKQRKGRAGRTQAGYCFHLYSELEMKNFEEYPIPSIEKSDITNDILDLMRLPEASTVKTVRNLLDEFISPPHEKFIINSLRTLQALGAITAITPEGTITPMGHAISKFRAIKANHARAIIASHFYGCSRAVCDIISLITIADGMINSIFLEYYADKKKSPEWNKKEAQRYMQIMKSFAHPMGDFMTLLKVYRMYMKVVEQLPEQPDNQLDIDNQVDDVLLELGEPLPQNQQAQQTQQAQQSVNKWCKDNYVHAKRMAQVRRTSRQLYETLQKALQPMQQHHHNQQHHKTKKDQEQAKFASVDEVMSELEPELPPIALRHSRETKKEMVSYYEYQQSQQAQQTQQAQQAQVGGFIKRIEKQQKMDKLEANVKRFATEDENIMMSLAIGNFVNLAVKAKQGDNVYVSCFAQTKKFAKINKDSFLNTYPKIVMYDEMFMSSRDAKFLKLNIVGKIPDNVFARIKELYGQYIKYCV
jgi:pre-mRNA-splicing factor ATP-dependent RNA helicase DHX15/PRP43